jgi:phospholipase/carboxylesterase
MTQQDDLGFIHRFEPGSGSATLLLLHGTGANENQLLGLGRELVSDANLVSPRGKVLENGMPRFFRRLALGVFDIEDLVARTHELADFVAEATAAYELDATRIHAVGFSNGANIAASMLLLRPEVLRGAVLLKPMIPFEPDSEPELDGKPVLIAAGRRDELVPAGDAEKLVALLERIGAEVTAHWSDAGHELTDDEVRAAQAWFAEILSRRT